MSKKILITGANGFVGSHLVDEAIKANLLTHAGVRKTSNVQYLKDPRINFFYYSFEQEDKLREQLIAQRFDYIILNAGVTIAKDKATYFKINAGYTRKICKILIEENIIPEKLVLVSSVASHGSADLQVKQILDRDSVPHPVTWYGESKLQAEQFVHSFRQIPSLVFRPTAVYGPRGEEMLPVYKTIKKGIAPKIGAGSMDTSFIHVKDLAQLIITATQSRHMYKSYFVGDGQVYPIEELNSTLAEIFQNKPLNLTIPFGVMKTLAWISEYASKITGKTPVLNSNKAKEYFARSFAIDVGDLEKDFNFTAAYDLRSGLKETIEWCQANKLL